jgi:hypothetical protein
VNDVVAGVVSQGLTIYEALHKSVSVGNPKSDASAKAGQNATTAQNGKEDSDVKELAPAKGTKTGQIGPG